MYTTIALTVQAQHKKHDAHTHAHTHRHADSQASGRRKKCGSTSSQVAATPAAAQDARRPHSDEESAFSNRQGLHIAKCARAGMGVQSEACAIESNATDLAYRSARGLRQLGGRSQVERMDQMSNAVDETAVTLRECRLHESRSPSQ